MNVITIRFTGNRTDSFAAFITTPDGHELRVAKDWLKWNCTECGRQQKPACPHAHAAAAANQLRLHEMEKN